MRSSESYPQREVVGNVNATGLGSMPAFQDEIGSEQIANIYDPASLSYNSPMASQVPVQRAIPVYPSPGQGSDWRSNSAAYAGHSSYPVPGAQWSGAPLEPKPGFFGGISNFFSNLVGGAGQAGQDVIGGLGGLLRGINFNPSGPGGPAQPMRSPQLTGRPSFGGTSFQSFFPGSNIGPTSGRITNPYSSSGPGARQPLGGPPSAAARAFTSQVQSRNIA